MVNVGKNTIQGPLWVRDEIPTRNEIRKTCSGEIVFPKNTMHLHGFDLCKKFINFTLQFPFPSKYLCTLYIKAVDNAP